MTNYLTEFFPVIVYFAVCATAALVLRLVVTIPDEVFRKLLHCILLGSLSVWVWTFDMWQPAALSALLFAVVVYPVLWLAESLRGYSDFVTERKRGELKSSLLLVFSMFSVVIWVCWGLLDDRMLVLASVYAWGFGDAAAALVGKRFGRHKLYHNKSVEGTAAMFLVSVFSVFIVLSLRGGVVLPGLVVTALVAGAVSAVTELFTSGGMDTVTCPLAAMAALIPLVRWFEGGVG